MWSSELTTLQLGTTKEALATPSLETFCQVSQHEAHGIDGVSTDGNYTASFTTLLIEDSTPDGKPKQSDANFESRKSLFLNASPRLF